MLPSPRLRAVIGWLALLAAGLLEIAWALGLKHSDGLTLFWPTLATVIAIAFSFGLMAIALRSLRSAPPTRCGPELAPSAASWRACFCTASRPIRCGFSASV